MVSTPSPNELAYALHTATCTYLLDDGGVCRWIVSHQGVAPSHVKQAIGAQFVACLDLAAPGGLVGELRVGAMALFVGYSGDRMVLLRTAPITHVDDRLGAGDDDPTEPNARARTFSESAPVELRQYGAPVARTPYLAAPPPRLRVVEDLGAEQTITIAMPRLRNPRKG